MTVDETSLGRHGDHFGDRTGEGGGTEIWPGQERIDPQVVGISHMTSSCPE